MEGRSVSNYSTGCPECGASRSEVRSASLDAVGHRIRHRRCYTCEGMFTTLEVAIPFSFSGADALKRERHSTEGPARRATDYFLVRRAERGNAWMIHMQYGLESNRCRRGLHVLEGDDVYVHPGGQRICKPCRRENSRARYANRMAKMPESLRAELREERRLESARRVEYRKEWMRRKREKAA